MTWRGGAAAVSMVDVFARAALDPAAEVVLATDPSGCPMAIPARHALADGSWCVLGRDGRVRIVVPGWTAPGRAHPVTELRALTFAGFLGLPNADAGLA